MGTADDLVSGLADDMIVCRGGLCTADRFTGGAASINSETGQLYGVSANAGSSVSQLASLLPQNQFGATTVGQLRALGGVVIPDPLEDNEFHVLIEGLTAEQLQSTFDVSPNIYKP